MTLDEWQRQQRTEKHVQALAKAISWFRANGMTAEEFITEANRILQQEQEDIVNAVETRKEEHRSEHQGNGSERP